MDWINCSNLQGMLQPQSIELCHTHLQQERTNERKGPVIMHLEDTYGSAHHGKGVRVRQTFSDKKFPGRKKKGIALQFNNRKVRQF